MKRLISSEQHEGLRPIDLNRSDPRQIVSRWRLPSLLVPPVSRRSALTRGYETAPEGPDKPTVIPIDRRFDRPRDGDRTVDHRLRSERIRRYGRKFTHRDRAWIIHFCLRTRHTLYLHNQPSLDLLWRIRGRVNPPDNTISSQRRSTLMPTASVTAGAQESPSSLRGPSYGSPTPRHHGSSCGRRQ